MSVYKMTGFPIIEFEPVQTDAEARATNFNVALSGVIYNNEEAKEQLEA